MHIQLREIKKSDLSIFFEQQLDPTALHMAAFTAKEPTNRTKFMKHWENILSDETIIKRTILYHEKVAGYIVKFEQFGDAEITYWLGKEYWGKGITTRAVREFLPLITHRPLYARAAKDNIASITILQKCGFHRIGEDKGFANARGMEIEEYIFKLA